MSLSDRDRELACKYAIGLDGSAISLVFTEHQLRAFLAERDSLLSCDKERDQLAIKEKDDAVREALEEVLNIAQTLKAPAIANDAAKHSFDDAVAQYWKSIRALIEPKD